ncbi:MAG: hypothetical protein RLZ51_1990 [Pseudomonadota bacterium]
MAPWVVVIKCRFLSALFLKRHAFGASALDAIALLALSEPAHVGSGFNQCEFDVHQLHRPLCGTDESSRAGSSDF